MNGTNYVEHVFLTYLYGSAFDRSFLGKWLELGEMKALFRDAMRRSVRQFGYEVNGRYDELALHHLDEMKKAGAFSTEGDEFTGEFLQLSMSKKDVYIVAAQKKNEVSDRIGKLGQPALRRALDALASLEAWPRTDDGKDSPPPQEPVQENNNVAEPEIPASDRIVRLDDNLAARDEIVERLEDLSAAVRGHNDEENRLGSDRDRIVAEVDSGKELLKASSVRTRALLIVLTPALTFIAQEFAGGIIGELASQLLAALRALLGV